MRCSIITIFLSALLPALVAGDACVVGGPADEVTQAKRCCYNTKGEWRQNYPVQAICIVADSTTNAASGTAPMAAAASAIYSDCVNKIEGEPKLNLRCIEGQEGLEKLGARSVGRYARGQF